MKFGLDVATTHEWGDVRRLTELAIEAEAAGWDGFFPWDVFLAEDGAPVADAWITLATIAHSTSRIRLGAMVTPVARRLPWEVARTVAVLDQLSGGRMILGVGLGSSESEFAALGLPVDARERAAMLDESLELIDRLWRGTPVTHSGPRHKLNDVRLGPQPAQKPRVPIWTAAGWPRRTPLRRAARWDGVYLMTNNQATNERLSPAEVAEAVEFVRANRTTDAPFDVGANVSTLDDSDGGAGINARMAAAGATWTMELTPSTFERHLALVRRGPPEL